LLLLGADAAEETVGVDTGSLDSFGCTGHWASSGCIRLLTAASLSAASGDSAGEIALVGQEAFSALWERDASLDHDHIGSSSQDGAVVGDGTGERGAGSWHVPYARLLPLQEAYGGLCRELIAAGHDVSRCHYMLRCAQAWRAAGRLMHCLAAWDMSSCL
jgi:hypothetical protein